MVRDADSRVHRNDFITFSCGPQLIISELKRAKKGDAGSEVIKSPVRFRNSVCLYEIRFFNYSEINHFGRVRFFFNHWCFWFVFICFIFFQLSSVGVCENNNWRSLACRTIDSIYIEEGRISFWRIYHSCAYKYAHWTSVITISTILKYGTRFLFSIYAHVLE